MCYVLELFPGTPLESHPFGGCTHPPIQKPAYEQACIGHRIIWVYEAKKYIPPQTKRLKLAPHHSSTSTSTTTTNPERKSLHPYFQTALYANTPLDVNNHQPSKLKLMQASSLMMKRQIQNLKKLPSSSACSWKYGTSSPWSL